MGVKQSKHVDISTNPKKNGEVKSVDDKITVTHFHGLHVIFSAHFVHLVDIQSPFLNYICSWKIVGTLIAVLLCLCIQDDFLGVTHETISTYVVGSAWILDLIRLNKRHSPDED